MIELLYFTAAWCGPCRMMAPVIQQLQSEGHKITKIDVDQERTKAAEYGIMAMPTFVVLRDGEVWKRATGARDKAALLHLLEA